MKNMNTDVIKVFFENDSKSEKCLARYNHYNKVLKCLYYIGPKTVEEFRVSLIEDHLSMWQNEGDASEFDKMMTSLTTIPIYTAKDILHLYSENQ